MAYQILVSNAEILDKFSILTIKSTKINNVLQIQNISKELDILRPIFNLIVKDSEYLQKLYTDLININTKLWDIEDSIRVKEKQQLFDDVFINLARSVYIFNDERAFIKKQINIFSGSELTEEKSYESY
jgi:hypothetical protein